MVKTYTTRSGDQWDMIAKRVYGEERYADYLMAQNYQFLDIYEFDAGTVLSTPPLPDSENDVLPSWRRSSK